LVSPVAPGSGLDELVRLCARWLEERVRQPVIVEPRPGANTLLAATHVAAAKPDGHTLLYAPSSTMVVNPYLYKSLPYRPLEDFAPVAKMVDVTMALVVAPKASYQSVADLAAEGRHKPRQLNFGYTSGGYRAMGAALARSVGMEVVEVPYRTLSNLLPDLVGGRIDYALLESSTAVGLLQSGQLRGLAVLGAARLAVLPQVPTLREEGVLDTPLDSWMALFAPAHTPRDVVDRVSALAQAFMHSAPAIDFAQGRGLVPAAQGPEELHRLMVADLARWRVLVERAGIERE
jgi:tripartite-type tricarboxylate transporter receptor subunit TctC